MSSPLLGVETDLRMLSTPEFSAECVLCLKRRKILSWQISMSDAWGLVCAQCARGLLLQQLRLRLQGPFRKVDLLDALRERDVNKAESQLFVCDFIEEGLIVETTSGLFWSTKPVEPLVSGAKRRRRRAYQLPSPAEILRRTLKLSREILEERERRKRTEWL